MIPIWQEASGNLKDANAEKKISKRRKTRLPGSESGVDWILQIP